MKGKERSVFQHTLVRFLFYSAVTRSVPQKVRQLIRQMFLSVDVAQIKKQAEPGNSIWTRQVFCNNKQRTQLFLLFVCFLKKKNHIKLIRNIPLWLSMSWKHYHLTHSCFLESTYFEHEDTQQVPRCSPTRFWVEPRGWNHTSGRWCLQLLFSSALMLLPD